MKLYEITKEFKEVESLEDIPEEAIRDTLEAIGGEFEDKAKAVIAYILNESIDIEALESHRKVIDQKIKTIKNRNESLRSYLRENMVACGITEISCPMFKAKIGKPSKVCIISDVDKVPEQFKKVTVSANKSDIAKALKAGETVEGARLEDGQARLTIK